MCYEGPDLFFFFFTIQVKCQSVFVPSVQNFLFALQQIVAQSWWLELNGFDHLCSVSRTVMISRYLNAAHTNHSVDYLRFTLINMWGRQCKRWL